MPCCSHAAAISEANPWNERMRQRQHHFIHNIAAYVGGKASSVDNHGVARVF